MVFTSSYSSQLGALISISKHFSKIKPKKKFRKIIIFQVSSKGDLNCDYSCFSNYSKLILGINFDIWVIKINSNFKRLGLLLFVSFLKFLRLNKNLSIWEPYPNWLIKLFYYRKINLNLFRNYFQDIKYYGDGFLCLSETSIPFWLRKEELSIENNHSNGSFYYFYNLNNPKNGNNKYIKIDSHYIKYILEKITPDLNKNINNDFQDLIIFPLTTFFETKRSSLESELSLYLEYLNKNVDKENNNLLIKPHPSNLKIKDSLLIERLKSQNFNVINNQFEINKIIDLPLKIIPLELLCLILEQKFNINYKNISIVLNSNATLSTSYLFPEIKCLKPFGKKLINKYLKKEFVKKRLMQEKILNKKIYLNKK